MAKTFPRAFRKAFERGSWRYRRRKTSLATIAGRSLTMPTSVRIHTGCRSL